MSKPATAKWPRSKSHERAAAGAVGAASKPGITQGLQQNAACSVRVGVDVLLVVFVGTALLDETHVLGVNPEMTGSQHLRPVQPTKKGKGESGFYPFGIREEAEEETEGGVRGRARS